MVGAFSGVVGKWVLAWEGGEDVDNARDTCIPSRVLRLSWGL